MYTYDRRIAKAIPISDREVDLLAKQILRELPGHLKFRDMSKSLWTTRGFRADWGYTLEENFRTTNVRGHPVSVTVEVRAVQMENNPSRYYVAGGSVEGYYHADSKGSPTGYKLHTTLVVKFNSERTPQEFLDNLGKGVYTELRSVLRHEVTHLKDLLLPGPGGQLMSPTDPRAYYNLPGEVRAFMRQIMDEVVAYAHEVGKDDPFFLYLDSKFIERALEKSTTWERVYEALTDENARLIRKAVARALQDVWPELMKLYPLNDE